MKRRAFIYSDPSSRRRRAPAALPGAMLLAALFLLAACGNWSFYGQLDGQLVLSPQEAGLAVDGKFTFAVSGGAPPYTFTVTGKGSIDPQTGQYVAPSYPTTDVVRVTDSSAQLSVSAITVYVPLAIDPSAKAMPLGGDAVFAASGGAPPYTFELRTGSGSLVQGTGADYNKATFTPSAPGSAIIRLTDDFGAYREAAVTVVSGAYPIIDPPSVTLGYGEAYPFTVSGGSQPYDVMVLSGTIVAANSGTIDGTNKNLTGAGPAPVTFSYQAVSAEASESADITVTDSTTPTPLTAQALVTVTNVPPLMIYPDGPTVLRGNGLTFTVSGGQGPYTFSADKGTIVPADATSADYTAPSLPGADFVYVTDDIGRQAQSKVTVK